MASRSVERFRDALIAAGLDDTIIELGVHARTAQQAADAIGCAVSQIIKSLVFADRGSRPLLVLAAGDVRVDEKRIAAVHGEPVSMADARLVRELAGYAIGGVPPFGHNRVLPTLIDRTLLQHETVWAAAGTPRHVFSLPVSELRRATGGQLEEVGAAVA
ncbi:MAG: YbaK/EbsC family protein [Halofilum sp. (in: g-proteobacteria)]|nr:YbaK/EbsC family protein [Halofilum sp. (in: g-proteobacteria)]